MGKDTPNAPQTPIREGFAGPVVTAAQRPRLTPILAAHHATKHRGGHSRSLRSDKSRDYSAREGIAPPAFSVPTRPAMPASAAMGLSEGSMGSSSLSSLGYRSGGSVRVVWACADGEKSRSSLFSLAPAALCVLQEAFLPRTYIQVSLQLSCNEAARR